jgi:thioredoxin reductase (NADPH)
MGHGESAAKVAMIMLNFTDDVDLLTRGETPTWSDETALQLDAHPVDVIEAEIEAIENGDDGWLEAIVFEDGARREYRGGFAMYGSEYNDDLARELGCECNDDGTVAVDDHGRTSVDGVFAVGDLVPGHNQIPVAMGQGAKAGIAIHYGLRRFPVPVDELEGVTEIDPATVPAVSEHLRERAAAHGASPSDD